MSETERRYTPGLVEVRAGKDRRSIGGYAAKFDKESRNLGGFVERHRADRVQPCPRQRLAGRDGPLQPRRQHAARHDRPPARCGFCSTRSAS
jgi:hypothetical protein